MGKGLKAPAKKKKEAGRDRPRGRRGFKFCKNEDCRASIFIHCYYCPKCGCDLRTSRTDLLAQPGEQKLLPALRRVLIEDQPAATPNTSHVPGKDLRRLKLEWQKSVGVFNLKHPVTQVLPLAKNVIAVLLQNSSKAIIERLEFEITLRQKGLQQCHRLGAKYQGSSSLMAVCLPQGQLLWSQQLELARCLRVGPKSALLDYAGKVHFYQHNKQIGTHLLGAQLCWVGEDYVSIEWCENDLACGTLEGDLHFISGEDFTVRRVLFGVAGFSPLTRLAVGSGVVAAAGQNGVLAICSKQELLLQTEVTNRKIMSVCFSCSSKYLLVALDQPGQAATLVSFLATDSKSALLPVLTLKTLPSQQLGITTAFAQSDSKSYCFSSQGQAVWFSSKCLRGLGQPKGRAGDRGGGKWAGRTQCACWGGEFVAWGDREGRVRFMREQAK